jgi:dethiobiotin synthetase
MNNGIFITGTDTGVGKTIVSAILIRSLIKKGLRVGVMKPLETGCIKKIEKDGREYLYPSDGMFLREVACLDEPIDVITPFRFELPLAPMVASDLEGKQVDIRKVIDSYKAIRRICDFMVIEGVGGLLVPITRLKNRSYYFVSDMIKDLNLPTIVVSRPTLGTINHTLLTINYLIKEGIKVKGVIINYHNPPENTIAEKTNPDILKEICQVPLIGIIPYVEDISIVSIDNIITRESLSDKICFALGLPTDLEKPKI